MEALSLEFKVNGQKHKLSVAPNKRLLDVLREDLNLIGVKEGCSVGECGACTVIMDGKIVNSCMVLAGQAQNSEVLTVEGLEKEEGKLHPLQQAFLDAGAVQCGFCTPGMLMSSYNLLQANPDPDEEEIKDAITGNFCRCTGYKQIIDAIELAAERMNR